MRKTELLALVQSEAALARAPGKAEEVSLAVMRSLSQLVPDPTLRRHFITLHCGAAPPLGHQRRGARAPARGIPDAAMAGRCCRERS